MEEKLSNVEGKKEDIRQKYQNEIDTLKDQLYAATE